MVALILTFKFVNTAKALRYCKRIDQICYLEKNIEQPREYGLTAEGIVFALHCQHTTKAHTSPMLVPMTFYINYSFQFKNFANRRIEKYIFI